MKDPQERREEYLTKHKTDNKEIRALETQNKSKKRKQIQRPVYYRAI